MSTFYSTGIDHQSKIGGIKCFKMEPELINFKENVDAWVKQIRGEVAKVTDISYILEENVDNTEHNYELIRELRHEIEELKHELNALKIIQIASLKAQMKKRIAVE